MNTKLILALAVIAGVGLYLYSRSRRSTSTLSNGMFAQPRTVAPVAPVAPVATRTSAGQTIVGTAVPRASTTAVPTSGGGLPDTDVPSWFRTIPTVH